jgi:prephenate dehydrogenase
MTRIASSPYEIWDDIIQTNHEEMLVFLDECIACLQSTRKRLEQKDMATDFRQAAKNRLSIPRDTRGFLSPHFDISVRVEDKPGEIADISGILAKKHINIKDIEVLKVREGDAGIIRLSFETDTIRKNAKNLLNAIGYYTRFRE